MRNKQINALEVIKLIPDELLDKLSSETGADYSVKKLKGKIIFKLYLYAILNCKTVSLRILEAIHNSKKFKNLFNLPANTIKHSAIGMRLATIDYRYFENIFTNLINSNHVDEIIFANKKINIRKIDSTMITLSSKLIKFGMDDSRGNKNFKYTVELNQGIPVNIIFFKKQKYFCEDNALPQAIKKKSFKSSLNIAIFDRGIQRKQSFIELAEDNIYFISRLTRHRYTVIKELPVAQKTTKSLYIISDQIVKFTDDAKNVKQEFRVIAGKSRETKKIISFITNVNFLETAEITQLYKSRWEIETFFKFIKQELNFKHLLSRNENGIRVVMYLTMIAAILLTIYKKVNKIIGWAVTKIKFLDELEFDLIHNWHSEISSVFNTKNKLFYANANDP